MCPSVCLYVCLSVHLCWSVVIVIVYLCVRLLLLCSSVCVYVCLLCYWVCLPYVHVRIIIMLPYVLCLLQLINKNEKIGTYKNGFINLALPFFAFTEPVPAPKKKVAIELWLHEINLLLSTV